MPLFKRNDERGNTETNYKRSRQIGLDTNISNYGWYTCAHCGRKLRKGDVDIDHILPRSKGGIDDPRNLQCLCVHCNRSKGNKTDNTKADLKHRKQTYGEYQRSVYLKQETKNTMNWIREDMKKRDDSDIKKLLGANEEELKPLMSWVKKEAKKRKALACPCPVRQCITRLAVWSFGDIQQKSPGGVIGGGCRRNTALLER